MEATKKIVPVETFDLNLLQQAFAEGRLFIMPAESSAEELREKRILAILDYVSRIDDCASSAYVPFITPLWRTVIDDPLLNANLFLQKGRNQGRVNRYRVLAIVTVLLEIGVYDQSHTLLELHHRLQNTTRKDSVYTSHLNYALIRSQRVHLRRLSKEIIEK